MGEGKWVQGSFKTIANTGVSPAHRCFSLFGVSGMHSLCPVSEPHLSPESNSM